MRPPREIAIFRRSRRVARLGSLSIAVCCTLLFSACSTLDQELVRIYPTPDIKRLSARAVLLDLPFEAQKSPDLCGLASVDMLAGYYGVPLNDIQRQNLSREAEANRGISGAELKTSLEQAGYFVAVFPGTTDREETGIYRQLDSRRPLIVMLENADGRSGHYVILAGYDPEDNRVVLLDPARGRVVMPFEEFKKMWISANSFTLLAMPHGAPKEFAGKNASHG